MAEHSPEFYKKQLEQRIGLLERFIRIKAPRTTIEFQQKLIEQTRIASGEYKAISGRDDEHDGGSLALV